MLKTIALVAYNKIDSLRVSYISERRKEELVEIIKLASRICTQKNYSNLITTL
jgi:hypothetical protein